MLTLLFKDLVEKLANDEVAEREAREIERLMCRIKLFCQHPKNNEMVEKKLKVNKDKTLKETTKLAYEVLKIKLCKVYSYVNSNT